MDLSITVAAITYASGITASHHVFMQMVDTLNTASDWHQLAVYKPGGFTKLHDFFQLSCMTKKNFFAQT